MYSVNDAVEKLFDTSKETKPEEIKLPDEVLLGMPCIENVQTPLVATETGKRRFEKEKKTFIEYKEQIRKELKPGQNISEVIKDTMCFELLLLGEIVNITEEAEKGTISKEQQIRKILEYVGSFKKGTIYLTILKKLQDLRKNGDIDGTFSLLTYNIGPVQKLLTEIINLDDYNIFFRALKQSGYATVNSLFEFYLKENGFSKEKISFMGRQLADKGCVIYMPRKLEQIEAKVSRGKFYTIRTEMLSFIDKFGNELQEAFIDPNADPKDLIDIKLPMCRHLVSRVKEKVDNIGVMIRPLAHSITESGGHVTHEFRTRSVESTLNLLVAQQVNMELEKSFHLSKFEELSKEKKRGLYQFSEGYVKKVLEKLRLAKECYPYIRFVDADVVEKMWSIISKTELEKKLQPVAYMAFLTAIQKKQTRTKYKSVELDQIGKFTVSEYGNKNMGGLTPLMPHVELSMPYIF